MSIPAATALTILQAAGTAYSLITVVKGLSEGDIKSAVLGGVGAFVGVNALAAGAAAGPTVGSELATSGATELASTAAGAGELAAAQTATPFQVHGDLAGFGALTDPSAGVAVGAPEAAAAPGLDLTKGIGVGDGALVEEGTGLLGGGGPSIGGPRVPSVASSASGAAPESQALFGGKVGGFLRDNKELVGLLGSGVKGYSEQTFIQRELDKRREDEEEARKRRGAAPNLADYKSRYKFNIGTGRVERKIPTAVV